MLAQANRERSDASLCLTESLWARASAAGQRSNAAPYRSGAAGSTAAAAACHRSADCHDSDTRHYRQTGPIQETAIFSTGRTTVAGTVRSAFFLRSGSEAQNGAIVQLAELRRLDRLERNRGSRDATSGTAQGNTPDQQSCNGFAHGGTLPDGPES